MKQVIKTMARPGVILVAAALIWNLGGAWLNPGSHQEGKASAAALTLQPVGIAPAGVRGAGSPQVPDATAGAAFTYQGKLLDNGAPANGQYDMLFTLYDALSGGNQVSSLVALTNQTVTSGLFTVSLDFGPGAFSGDPRWLEIGVKAAGGPTYTTLAPRQLVTPAPFSLGTRWEGTSNKPYPYNSLPRANRLSTVDASTNVGYFTSIAVGADGLGLIVYQDANNRHLKVAHCSNIECSTATNSTVDSTTIIGNYTSIAIGADKLGLISYFDSFNYNLMVAHCSNVECTSATTSTIDSTGNVGSVSSLTIGADGLGLIVYQDFTNGAIKAAHCSNATCSSATSSIIDQPGTVYYTAIVEGADGLGLIAYGDSGNMHLKVAHCSNVVCSSATITTYDAPYYAQSVSVTVGSDGLGLIIYSGAGAGSLQLKAAHCSNLACSAATLAVLDTTGSGQYQTSVAVGQDGLGLISYFDSSNTHLKVAHCSNVLCNSATTTTVDSAGYVGSENALTIGVDGLGLVSYHDATGGYLKVVHCASPLCLPYQHRR